MVKKQLHPAVAVVALVAAAAMVAFFGFRAVNSTPKLDYPKDFNPAGGGPGARR